MRRPAQQLEVPRLVLVLQQVQPPQALLLEPQLPEQNLLELGQESPNHFRLQLELLQLELSHLLEQESAQSHQQQAMGFRCQPCQLKLRPVARQQLLCRRPSLASESLCPRLRFRQVLEELLVRSFTICSCLDFLKFMRVRGEVFRLAPCALHRLLRSWLGARATKLRRPLGMLPSSRLAALHRFALQRESQSCELQ